MARRPSRRASSRRSRQIERGTVGNRVRAHSSQPTVRNSTPLGSQNSIPLGSRKPSASSRTGEIHVMPASSSRESASAYHSRSRKVGFMVQDRARSRVRSILVAALVLAVLVGAALFVARFVFVSQASARMHLDDPALSEVLTAPEEEGDPFYTLVAGTYTDPILGLGEDGPHLLLLVRVDEQNGVVTCLSIPNNVEMMLSDDNYHVLSYAQILGGNAELVAQVQNLTGVSISHLVELDADGLMSFVDAIGGVELELDQEVDDPDTGSIYLPEGTQTLNGEQALTLVRADNYATPQETRSRMQCKLIEAIAYKLLNGSFITRLRAFDSLASSISTDLTFNDFWEMSEAFREGHALTFYSSIVPGGITVDPDGTFYAVTRAAFDNMMTAIDEGRNPDEAATISGLTPNLVRITVRNGAGINGGATQVAELLESAGYQVPEKGNADNYVYDETLVVYKDDLMKPTAEDVLSIMGNGRVIEAGLFYEFETDLMVIIGKDWIPTS